MKARLFTSLLCLLLPGVAAANMLCTDNLQACIANEPFDIEAVQSAPGQMIAYSYRNRKHRNGQAKRGQRARYRYRSRTSNTPRSMPASIPANGSPTFVFDPRRLAWGAYNAAGELIRHGRASGGKGYCADVRRSCRTPRGHFRVHAKRGANCRSSKYPLGRGGAPMPHCMFFHRGYAIHGSPNVPDYNASHGCIRVRPPAAKWLHQNFIRHGTRVIVRPY